ncbi:discoidin domain-containing protein [Sedimentisphaera salicampi]|uniref:discoidin domain-containing protein n=1 Tax=Sedimentisphaera salicampi TaxID=1941349 RepID=UPI000B9BAE74|nr:discoidin domain-containing protein [Sedimentisphaera salicampi]OXU14033.1 Sialidase precursor [Sedimentisphaera salicampi]
MKYFQTAAILIAAICVSAQNIDLSGQWRFSLDANDAGVSEKWFSKQLSGKLQLPGSLQEQGFGEIPSVDTKWTVDGSYTRRVNKIEQFEPYVVKNGLYRQSMWWTPDRVYVGAAWYQKDVEIPNEWKNTTILLHLERVHWETQLWVDNKRVGMQNSISAPHQYNLSDYLTPGKHRITVRVDNRIKDINVGAGGHNISDHTQSNWNGIIGDMYLESRPLVHIDQVSVDTIDTENPAAKVVFDLNNSSDKAVQIRVNYQAKTNYGEGHQAPSKTFTARIPAGKNIDVEKIYAMGKNAVLWDEFTPAVYTLSCQLQTIPTGEMNEDGYETTFGLRRIYADGNQLKINGRNLFLRGTLDCCIFPNTGYPPMDKESWVEIYKMAKSCGLNHVRYHSWCPPEAAFEAADDVGILLQSEMAMWVGLGNDQTTDDWLFEEGALLLSAYGNHPSCAFMAIGNELRQEKGSNMADKLLRHYKKGTHGTMLTDNVRKIFGKEAEFAITGQGKFYDKKLHSVRASDTDFDYSNIINNSDIPIITHEDGQWATLPNFDVRKKYKGSLHPYYLDIYEDFMRDRGTLNRYEDYYMASGKFQTLLYKSTWEAALRTPGYGGVQMLDLRDFPGQGYAPVGSFDEFWESKGYVTTEEYNKFCNVTTPLARFDSFVWESDQDLEAQVMISHYGPKDLEGKIVKWNLTDKKGKIIGKGSFGPIDLPTGYVTTAGNIKEPLSSITKASQVNLSVKLEGLDNENSWDMWVYPNEKPLEMKSNEIIVSQLWNDETIQKLNKGKTVLLVPRPESVAGNTKGSFTPIFWTRIMFSSSSVHTVGIYCDNQHPALADFPTQNYTNWQWYDLLENSKPLVINSLPKNYKAIVEPIDDWTNPRRLGLLMEAEVGRGKLMVCSIDILNDLKNRPAARQLRKSLVNYMKSKSFKPAKTIDIDSLSELFMDPLRLKMIDGTTASDSAAGYEVLKAIDGNEKTFWHSPWKNNKKMPQEIIIDLGEKEVINGMTYLPRQDAAHVRVKDYEISVSMDGKTWSDALHSGSFDGSEKRETIHFSSPRKGRFLKFKMLSTNSSDASVAVAEIEPIIED